MSRPLTSRLRPSTASLPTRSSFTEPRQCPTRRSCLRMRSGKDRHRSRHKTLQDALYIHNSRSQGSQCVSVTGPGKCCSPRHMMLCDSRNEGLGSCVTVAWRACQALPHGVVLWRRRRSSSRPRGRRGMWPAEGQNQRGSAGARRPTAMGMAWILHATKSGACRTLVF